MRLTIAAIGRMKAGPEQVLSDRYIDRLKKAGSGIGITAVNIIELPESRAGKADQRKREEAESLLSKIGDAALFVFDERGKSSDSRGFADCVRHELDNGTQHLALMIGGPDGLDDSLRASAARTISFGKLTIPHQLVRILVAEQAYRAATILTNHPYHRD